MRARFALLASMLLASLAFPASTASHAAGTAFTFTTAYGALSPTLRDIARAPQGGLSDTGWGCNPLPSQTPVWVEPGQEYVAVVSAFSTNLTVKKSGGAPLFSLDFGTFRSYEPTWNVRAVWHGVDVGDSSSRHAAVAFTPTHSDGLTVACTTNSARALDIPDDAIGFVGAAFSSGTTRLLPVFRDVALQSESGILASQTNKAPPNSKLSWSRMNTPSLLAKVDTVGSGSNIAEIAQSFSAPPGGGYVEVSRIGMFGSGNYECSGTLRVSITDTLSVPWNDLAESAAVEVAWTLSGAAPSASYVTVDWLTATISEDAASISLGTPTWSIGGATVTGHNLKALAPPITPSQGTYYLRAAWSQGSCGSYAYVMSRLSGCDCFAGGTAWTVSGDSWAQSAGHDLGGLLLNFYGGNRTYEWRLNATATALGGADYVYVAEHERDSQMGYAILESSWGGRALRGKNLYELQGSAGTAECTWGFLGDSACLVREYRLGYTEVPFNRTTPLTITLNTYGIGRNILYVGTLVDQPPSTHIHELRWDNQVSAANDLVVYRLWSTDDYYALAEFTVKECANVDCTQFGDSAANFSYEARICDGLRIVAGLADTGGVFSITGQDLPGCRLELILAGAGYAETSWTAEIPAAGTYRFVIGIFGSQPLDATAQLSATTITFAGNSTVIVPERLNVTITRARASPLFIGLDRIDSTTGLIQHNVITATYWKQDEPSNFQFYYPSRAKSTSGEIGLYILWVMNETGRLLAHEKLFILPQEGSVADYDVSITADITRAIEKAGYVSAQQTFQSQHQASLLATQKSIRDQVYEDFQKISDYGWFVMGFLLFLATVRAFRR